MTTGQKELPAGWKWVKLGEVCEFAYGSGLPKAKRLQGDTPVYGAGGIIGMHNEASIEGPAIVIGRKGSAGAVSYSAGDCWPIDTTYYVTQTQTQADIGWLLYLLISLRLSDLTEATAVGGLNRNKAYKLPIPLPPLGEQKRIAGILNKAEGIKKLREEADKKTEELIPAIFHEMFGDGSNWPNEKLDTVCKEISYGVSAKVDKTLGPEEGDRLLTIANVNIKGVIDFTTERYIHLDGSKKEKFLLHDGDVLFNWRNGSLDHIGKVAFWENPTKHDTYHVSFLLKLRTDKTQFNPYYLWAYLDKLHKSGYYRKASRRQINIKFNASELGNLSVPVPPIGLQQKFVDRVNEANPIVEQQKNSASRITNLSQSLLQRAFRGEL